MTNKANEIASWQTTLSTVGYAVFTGLADSDLYSEAWAAIKTLTWAIAVLVVRLIMLVLFPISIPLLFIVVRVAQKGVAERRAKAAKEAQEMADEVWQKSRYSYRDVDGVRL